MKHLALRTTPIGALSSSSISHQKTVYFYSQYLKINVIFKGWSTTVISIRRLSKY